MLNNTRAAFTAYIAQLARLNGVPDATQTFSVAPTVEQTLEDRIQEQAEFLGQINVMPVRDLVGEKLGIGANTTVAARTDTTVNDRVPREVTNLEDRRYECKFTEFDTTVKYATLDVWSKFPDFQTRIRNQVIQQIARDRLTIGWNGTSAAAVTDRVTNPLLQDVNVGWLEHIRTKAPQRVLTTVKVGDATGRDYVSFDALVFDAVSSLIEPWYRAGTDIRVYLGDQLLTEKYMTVIEGADRPTEIQAMQNLILNRSVGGKIAERVPFFPPRSILITWAKNLSIYWQEGSRRRHVMDNPKRSRIEDYQSVNEAYVVEDLGGACLIDGVELPDPDTPGAWI